MLVLGFYNMTYCHSSWEFLNELKWGLFISVLYSLTIWLASLFKCIAGDRANGESSASQQQVCIFKKNHKTPQQKSKPNNPQNPEKMDKKDKKVPFCCFLPFLQHSHEKEIPHYLTVHVLGQFLPFKQQYLCFFIRNGPIFSVSQRKKPGFSLQVHGFPAKFMKFWLAVTSPVLKAIKKSEGYKWVCRSVNMAHLGILLLNTRIIFCIEAYLLEVENRLL